MGTFLDALLWIVAIIAAILNTILFFKLWGACDNIKRIANKYAPMQTEKAHRARQNRKPAHVEDANWDDFSTPPETKEEVERWLNEGK